MPDWSQVAEEINNHENQHQFLSLSGCDIVRRRYLQQVHNITQRNVIIYYSGWLQKRVDGTEINDEDKNGFMTVLHELDRSKGLDLILHTPGGDTSATESIVDYLRSMFGTDIRAFVPQLAMSGGTVIACACKEIYMGRHSSLGPIDPQIMDPRLGQIPAHGVIEEFERAIEEIKRDPDRILVWQPILHKYNPAFIGQCEKVIEMTKDMVTNWLRTGMFASYGEKEASLRSERIAEKLADYELLKTHDRHLPPDTCRRFGLNISVLEDEPSLQDAVLSVHHACIHTFTKTQAFKIIENQTGKAFIKLLPPAPPQQMDPLV